MTNVDNRDIIDAEDLSTAYDSIFRTMVNDCSKLLFPLLNEVFGEMYTDSSILIRIFEYDAQIALDQASLQKEYQEIQRRLETLTQDGTISAFYKVTIMEMSVHVMNRLLENYDNVREGVKSIMVGPTLDYEAKRIWKEGRKEGETLMGRLVTILLDQGKPENVKSAIEDSAIRQALYKKYNLL